MVTIDHRRRRRTTATFDQQGGRYRPKQKQATADHDEARSEVSFSIACS